MEIENINFDSGRRIAVDLGTQLQIQIDTIEFKFKSNLVGIVPDKFLIIGVPPMSSYGNIASYKYIRGTKIIVRYLYKGNVFGFQTELIEDLYRPLKLLFLAYPQIIETHNLRSLERVACLLPVKITIKDEETEGVIEDVNVSGCRCVFKGPSNQENTELLAVEINDGVSLQCHFPDTEGEQTLKGNIRSIQRDADQLSVGIKFEDINPEVEQVIGKYIMAVDDFRK